MNKSYNRFPRGVQATARIAQLVIARVRLAPVLLEPPMNASTVCVMTSHSCSLRRPIAAVGSLVVLLAFAPSPTRAQGNGTASASAGVRAVYEEHNKAAAAARSAGDWATVRKHAAAVDTLFNGNPSTLMAYARAAAKMGDSATAFSVLRAVVSMGIMRNLKGDKDLVSLHSSPAWPALIAMNDGNVASIGSPHTEFALPAVDLLAEDVVWDGARQRFLVSSVRKGEILAVSRNGRSAPFVRAADGRWGMFALAVDSAASRLWATTVAMPHFEKLAAADTGKSAILRMNLATGAVEKRYDLRPTERGNAPGDVALAPNGDLYVSDSRSGALYVIRRQTDSLEVFIPEGTFMSPQGPAVSDDGRAMYVADYVRGLARVDLSTRSVSWLAHERSVAVSGIDGLTVVEPGLLVAIQNGVFPNRVMAIGLDAAGTAITSARVIAQDTSAIREPTHGLRVGDTYLFIANSGWDGFGEDGALLKDGNLTPPAVVSVKLPRR
jgi:sugar lactone lactonase YvrE